MKGSVATLSGLVQLPFGAEKPELPHEETEESEKDEQTDPERAKEGRCRESLMRSHSCAGLSGVASTRGAGVLGGVKRRCDNGIGDNRRPFDVGVGWQVGLAISTGSDISIVGMTVSESGIICGSAGVIIRLRLILYTCRGGGGGCVALCSSICCESGVFGRCCPSFCCCWV